jgi:polysaccharide chain length determinant protein (PEP-CTERM system associated)
MNSDLSFYFELLKKRLPVMMVIFVLCAALGVGLALTMPPKYRAEATLLVEGAEIPDVLVVSTVQTEASKELQALQLRLMTRSNLIDIANKFGVFAGQTGLTPNDIVENMRDMTSFRIDYGGREFTTFMTVSFESGDPQIAANVVNELVTLVLRADAERRTGESGETLEFFQQRVDRLTQELAQQSAKIVAFKEANKDALPETLDYRLNRQTTLQERLNLMARDRTTLIEQRNRLEAVGSAAGAQQVPMTPQQQEIARLETELRNKLAIYAPDSATIRFLRKRIDLLKTSEPIEGESPDGNSINTMLELQLAEIDSRLKSLEEERRVAEAELAALGETIERTPSVAIALGKLDREYTNTQTMYNEAVAARSTAEQGVDVEVAAKGERVALIEQATVPNNPSSPNRKMIAGGGVVVGSGLAALFFTLTELLNRSIRRPVDLTRGLGVQPLATIPFLEQEGTRRRRRLLQIVFIVAALVAIPVGLWAVHTYVMPLELLADLVLERLGL